MSWVDETNTWYVDGFPISFHDIEKWYENYCIKTSKEKRTLQDPRFSERSCKLIASEIVNIYKRKIGSKTIQPQDVKSNNPYRTKTLNENVLTTNVLGDDPETRGLDWSDYNTVMKKAIDVMEQNWKDKREKERKRREDAVEFWKKYGNKSAPVSPPVSNIMDWRKILGFGINEVINEEQIKKKYKKQAMLRHPDRGGNDNLMYELFEAKFLAYKFIGKEEP